MSDTGLIKSLSGIYIRKNGKPCPYKELIKKPYKTWNGYYVVHMGKDVNKSVLVHRAVMETFNPIDGMENLQVNHIDGDKSNNHLSNLEWVDRSGNMRHAFENGIWHPGRQREYAILSEKDIEEIKQLIRSETLSQKKIAELYNISTTRVRSIRDKYLKI